MHLLLALVAVAQQPTAPPPSPSPDSAHVVIVATTDVHGRVLGWDYVRDAAAPGGLARAASMVESLRAQYPDQVVLVDAGDLIEGNPFATYFAERDSQRPHPVVDALNAMQYDAATPGNHEFDFGADVLARATGDATYRYVSANIFKGATDTLVFPPYAVVVRGGVKIGITGLTTPGVMVWDRSQLVGRIRVRSIAEAAALALRRLDLAGVDLKVVLVHSGLNEPSSYDTAGVGAENAALGLASIPLPAPRPDLVIVGHSHKEMRDYVVNGVHFVQPRNFALSLAVVHVGFVKEAGIYRVASMRSELLPLTSVPEQPRFVRRFAAAHERVRSWAATALGTAGPGFAARYGRAEDTPLLDFINEVQRRHAGADLSAAADADLSAGLPEGEVRERDVAGVYPYENTLRAVRISGEQLRAYLEQSARYFRTYQPGAPLINDSIPGFNFDVVSGVTYVIDLTQPEGRRIRGLAYRGRAVAPTDSFTLALNSYRQAGGGGYAMIAGARVVYDRGESIRDLLAAEIRTRGHLVAQGVYAPSWSIAPADARAALRQAFTPAVAAVVRPDSTLLRVLAINDFHGALEPQVWPWSDGRPVGGAAALKPWLDSLARVCFCTSIRLDAGDEMQGTPVSNFTFGRPAIAAMNALRIDAAAIGNHEFDWGVDTLRARMAEAHYRFLAANITDSAGTARPDWAEPFTVVERNGVRVAVIGVALRETPETTAPRNVRGLAFGDGAAAVRRVLPQARAAAGYVIVLAHVGGFCGGAGDGAEGGGGTACHGEIIDLARGLDSGSVDLIVSGHTHSLVNTVVNGIPIVQARSSGAGIAVVDFVRAGAGREVHARIETPFSDRVNLDPTLVDALRLDEQSIATITDRPVARFAIELRRRGDEYGLGRLIADAERNVAKTDVALVNNGGIRADLAPGLATYGDLFKVEPFQNRLLRLAVSGKLLKEALEHAVAGDRADAHVAGLEVWYDPRKPAGRRIKKLRLANGKDVDDDRTYTLAVSDFLAAGGSGYAMLRGATAGDVGITDLDALIQYLPVLRQPITPPDDERLHREGGGR